MINFRKYIDTVDKKAALLSIVCVFIFLVFVYFKEGDAIVARVESLISKSHESSGSSDIYCSKPTNRDSAFCSDRRAATNEKWKEVSSGSSKSKTVFSFRH